MSVTKLLTDLHKIHTTEKSAERIRKNLKLTQDPFSYCMKKLEEEHFIAHIKGKNWYVEFEDCILTINANTYTIITAHKPDFE